MSRPCMDMSPLMENSRNPQGFQIPSPISQLEKEDVFTYEDLQFVPETFGEMKWVFIFTQVDQGSEVKVATTKGLHERS